MLKFQKYIFISFLIIIIVSCKDKVIFSKIDSHKLNVTLKKKTKIELKNWHFKDLELDTIPGISLDRAYDSLLTNKKGKKVIVAVIDTKIDINHESLSDEIWINTDEIHDNNIDDDQNGYIDDINGWNFLGNSNGENNEFVNYEYTRILTKFNPIFQNKNIKDIDSKDSLNFIIYKRAEIKYFKRTIYAKKELDYINMVSKGKRDAEKELSKYFARKNYTINDLDSLKTIYPKNKLLQKMIRRKSNFLKIGFTDKYINIYRLKAKERIDKLLNIKYNDRKIQADNPNNILNNKYGSNIVNNKISLLNHSTQMAGAIVNIGKRNEIKIMPLVISAHGDEHDKDIALAIKYAVDNGAKIINMSFAKEFSLYPNWVLNAFKYAEKNNVLIINAAANEGDNINNENITWFPNDHGYFEKKEVVDNFLKIGSSGPYVGNKLKPSFSNYGNIDVDLFTPGKHIYTTLPNNKYTSSDGTSISCAITSGVAALLYSYK